LAFPVSLWPRWFPPSWAAAGVDPAAMVSAARDQLCESLDVPRSRPMKPDGPRGAPREPRYARSRASACERPHILFRHRAEGCFLSAFPPLSAAPPSPTSTRRSLPGNRARDRGLGIDILKEGSVNALKQTRMLAHREATVLPKPPSVRPMNPEQAVSRRESDDAMSRVCPFLRYKRSLETGRGRSAPHRHPLASRVIGCHKLPESCPDSPSVRT
jgi:hypothetical protein